MAVFENRIRVPFATRRVKRPFSKKKSETPPLQTSVLLTLLTVGFATWIIIRQMWQPTYFPFLFQDILPILELTGGLTIFVLWLFFYTSGKEDTQAKKIQTSVDALYDLSPFEFEEYVGKIFQKRGYRIKLRGKSGDLGVDIELRKKNGKKAVVQCKRYKSTVGPEIVRELYGTMIHERAAHAFLVTTAEISNSAHDWAKNKPMTLIDGKKLVSIAAELDLA